MSMIQRLPSKSLLAVCGAALLFLTVLWLVPHTPEPVYRFMQDGTGFLVVNTAHLLGLPAYYDPSNFYFAVAGFTMQLLEECVALHYHAILILAILLTPGQPWRRKFAALLFCNAALVFFNVMRLILLGIVGAEYPEQFYLVHDFIWQVAFAILTVFLCLAWIRSPSRKSNSRYSVLFYSLVFSGAFALAFNAVKISYLSGLAWAADKILLLSNYETAWSSRWWIAMHNSFVVVRLDGEKIFYALSKREYSVNLWPDMLGLVLFWGFCAGGLFWLWRRKEAFSMVRLSLGVCVGSLLLAFVHVSTIVVLGWILRADPEMVLGSNFLWQMRGVSVIFPVFCWWLVWKKVRRQPEGGVLFV